MTKNKILKVFLLKDINKIKTRNIF